MAENLDDMIVSLMSMGFDIADCQDAISFGKKTVESAVEWLVAGKPGFQAVPTGVQETNPSLRLRPHASEFESSSVAFVKPNPIQSDPAPSSHDQTSQSEANRNNQSESTQHLLDQSESAVVSRLHLSDQQRKVKEGFEQKKRDEAKKQAVLEKKRQKEEHARVLKEIAEDREKKKLTMGSHKPTGETTGGPGPASTEGSATASATTTGVKSQAADTTSDNKSSTCLLQLRLPDGRSLRHSFSASSTLRDVWNFTSENVKSSMAGYMFIQPFPHHEFSREEMLQSLTDLRLTPTGSLVLQKKSVTQSTDVSMTETEDVREEPREVTPMDSNESHPSRVHDADPTHFWGQGQNMEGVVQDEEEAVQEAENQPDNEDISDEEGEDNLVIPGGGPAGMGPGGMFPGFPGGRGRGFPPGGMPFPGGGMAIGGGGRGRGGGGIFGMEDPFGHGAEVFGGVGQRLVPEGHPDHDDSHHHRPLRDLALERAQARQAHAHQVAVQDAGSAHLARPVQPVLPSLLLCCLKHITHRLNDPRHKILSLAGISEDMAQVIIAHLLKEKQLKPKTLNAFIPCYLRRLIVDCYPYVTNDLLTSVRLHTNLSQLSLSSCPLITDGGLQCLHTLKKLKKFNLSCCRQITNKVIPVLNGMPNLTALNLEGTGVNDTGVIEFLDMKPQFLQHLNLNRTEVTQAIISHLIPITTLKSLSLEDTKVASLTGIQELQHLESLNVARTLIVTESLLCLMNHPSLVSLNVANTDNVNGDQALQNLTGLNLQYLNLPSRHTTTSLGMQYISGFPLVSLDLTNFIFVADEGMEHIGKIVSLKKLLLCNTKLTDEGMLFLEGLVHLEVLNIDRTMVTNDGASVIGGFTNLLELSMVSTGVTSRFLLSGVLNKCINLMKLNLSKTLVTNKGLKSLVLPSLHLLNLDGTKVRADIQELMVTNCPRLTQVSLRNLEPYTLEDQEADMEAMEEDQ